MCPCRAGHSCLLTAPVAWELLLLAWGWGLSPSSCLPAFLSTFSRTAVCPVLSVLDSSALSVQPDLLPWCTGTWMPAVPSAEKMCCQADLPTPLLIPLQTKAESKQESQSARSSIEPSATITPVLTNTYIALNYALGAALST